jgi:hypothetical protein
MYSFADGGLAQDTEISAVYDGIKDHYQLFLCIVAYVYNWSMVDIIKFMHIKEWRSSRRECKREGPVFDACLHCYF